MDGPVESRAQLLALVRGYRISQAIYVVTQLGIPDLLADGPREIDELASATESHAPSLRRVLLFLAGVGVLDKVGPQRFARPLLAAVGVLPIIAYFGMASFLGWGGILLGILFPVGRGLGEVLFLKSLNEKISSAFHATVISMSNLGIRASFCLLGPLVGYGIDAWGLPSVLSALGSCSRSPSYSCSCRWCCGKEPRRHKRRSRTRATCSSCHSVRTRIQ